MKRTIVLLISVLLLNLSSITTAGSSSTAAGDSIKVFSTPDLYNLANQWAGVYNRLYPETKIKIVSISDAMMYDNINKEGGIGFVSNENISGIKSGSFWKAVVGRDVIVPVINSNNPYLEVISHRGISPEAIAKYLRDPASGNWGTLLNNKEIAAVRNYSLNDESVSKGIAEFLQEDMIGNSEAMKRVFREIESVAQSSSSVVITGESGTGKELVARAIHSNSPRKFFPLVSVHCGALTESLLESELFGHEKGAFTGAMYNRKGRFEMADNGTIFLDEIATISTKMQIDLLRVLETKKFVRVGGNKEISSDFRVICATNRDIKGMVEKGSFREDLFYRLNVVNIYLPALRERLEDIPLLVDYFIKKYCTSMNRQPVSIDPAALRRLEEFSFPGNVRELENIIERAIVVGNGKKISLKDLPLEKSIISNSVESLDDLERMHILNILNKYSWNISRTAKALKVDRVTLYNKISKYGLKSAD